MVALHHQLNGHKFEQAPGVGDGQGSLACCSPWGCKESDTTEQLDNNNNLSIGEGTLTHSSILAWRIPWTEEPGGPQSMGLQRAGHI